MSFFDLSQLDQSAYEQLRSAEEQAKRQRLHDRSMHRFTNRFSTKQPFLIRHKSTRRMSEVLSYFFNAISLIGLWYALKVVLEVIPIPYLNYVLSAVILLGFEIIKRKYSDQFWDYWHANKKTDNTFWYNFAINFIVLLGISLGGSVYGVYFVATDNSPEAKLMGETGDPEAIALQDRVKTLDADIKAMKEDPSNYNHEGKFYYKLLDDVQALKDEKLALMSTLRNKHGIYNMQNEDILTQWRLRRDFRAYAVVILTLLFEFLFEICMGFNSRYDYILYLCLAQQTTPLQSTSPAQQVSPSPFIHHTSPTPEQYAPTPRPNGTPVSEMTKPLPIGFPIPQKKMEAAPTPQKSRVHTCTHVYTAKKSLEDVFTVPHHYFRGGEKYTVHYSSTQIQARINQYEDRVREAEQLAATDPPKWQAVLDNRRSWLEYWQDKQQELNEKLKLAPA